jgi:hypothetical protein
MDEDKYSVVLTPIAIQDLDEIYQVLYEYFSFAESVEKVMNRIENAVYELNEYP